MKEKIIAIFDVGKTNKKTVLFDRNLRLISEDEIRFDQITDDDGFECDDIERIEKWVSDSLVRLARSDKYELTAVNYSTYGATLAYLDPSGKRFTPVYNYLKPIDEMIPERLYRRYGGQDEFCRRTASPALGMLNSGMQILWLRSAKPAVFSSVRHILHFPQYISYLVTGKVFSEHTSIGCHTALWDFDNMAYHPWVADNCLSLPEPIPVDTMVDCETNGRKFRSGIGIHDSSASLAPYFTGGRGKFLLLSTGTWCINMNPFNSEKLTAEQLDRDCLCYLSITRQPVKSSRFFLGNLHVMGVKMLNEHFRTTEDFYKLVRFDHELYSMLRKRYTGDRRAFLNIGPASGEFRERIDLFDFKSFDEAYHQMMSELCELTIESVKLILPEKDDTENIYITGGFARNEIFIKLITRAFPDKKVYTTEISNATALGAAIVVYRSINDKLPELDLGLTECHF
ncbi:MAG: FGGY family carbohydrate kinase [Bacteroidales bacterium]